MYVSTPTIYSTLFSNKTALKVFLKLECTQPSGSFKLRGVAHACNTLFNQGAKRFISSSGGNSGYAVAYAGHQLNVPVTVVVPETTSLKAQQLIQSENAEVIVHGTSWQEANTYAQSLVTEDAKFIHPFDDPLLWEGHASMIDELAQQCEKPDVIICSVGGGGLLCGVGEGLIRNNWTDVGILAVETQGAASFDAALKNGAPTEIASISSKATSLGVRMVCQHSYDLTAKLNIKNLVLSDAEAFQGSADLLNNHRLLTEPACGVSVAALNKVKELFPEAQRVVVIVCGGVGISADKLSSSISN